MIFIFVFICTILILLNNNVFGYSNNNDDCFDDGEEKKIEELIYEEMNAAKIPGMAVAIVSGDKTIYQNTFGYAELEKKKPITSKSLFEIGSNTKAFTALGILQLHESGLIDLNDTVNKYIPWFKVKYKGKVATITIEELLHHTSGIPFNCIDKIPISDADSAIEETVKNINNIELDSQPGFEFQYSSVNYDVLGFIIQNVTETSYESYIEENVLKPMGLQNTSLNASQFSSKNIVEGYKISYLVPRVYNAPIYRGNKPAGYIVSNIEDMEKWLKIQMGSLDKSKFNFDLIKESHLPNYKIKPLKDGSTYAAGWFVSRNEETFFHGGNNPNFSSYILFRPKEQLGIVILSNINSTYTSIIANEIDNLLNKSDKYYDTKDLNMTVDIISLILITIEIIDIILVLSLIIRIILEIRNNRRRLYSSGLKDVFKIFSSILFVMGIFYCIYKIPYVFYKGVSWEFLFVWLPVSIQSVLFLLIICILLTNFYLLLITFYRKNKRLPLILLSFLSIISGFGNALVIFIINLSLKCSNSMKINLFMLFMIGLIFYVYGQKLMRECLINYTNDIVYTKRLEIVRNILLIPLNKFENIQKEKIKSSLINDTEIISKYANILISGLTSSVTLIFCFLYLAFIDFNAFILSNLIMIIIAYIYYYAGKYANVIEEQSRDIQNLFYKFVSDLINGFKELSLNEKKKNDFIIDIENCCIKYRKKRRQSALAFANVLIMGELLFTLAIGAIALVFPLIIDGLSSENVSSYVFILLYMTGPVHGILHMIPESIEVRVSMNRIDVLLSQLSFSSDCETNNACIIEGDKILRLNEVEYIYNIKDEGGFKLGPISYEFKPGEIVFITGGNGSGKSTLAKVITGLYTPSKGDLYLNDVHVTANLLTSSCSAIFSDYHLFDALYGIDYSSKEEDIRWCLEVLDLDKKVSIEKGRFSTTKLSTGQRKRLALLVSYLEDRPIYLFDEWAADQDPEFRYFFYKFLLPAFKKRKKCIIVITHDESYFNCADKLIKMELGKVCDVE
ncbi:peptide ABC transporter [Lacrimispora algidixylanolytica]|uniref:Peptide ABC transporter n=2 Tax=Lacrimispora algidixylanolytica TaxID=94868 RepID=A0A419T1A7_9FIRM|nr:peptide ABC transporter [Lacrimispora algidixylanolytica]